MDQLIKDILGLKTTFFRKQNAEAKDSADLNSNVNSAGSTLSIESLGNVCRICYSGCKNENLMSACGCSGSVGLVHPLCLGRWILSRDPESKLASSTCEICHIPYQVQILPRPGSFFKFFLADGQVKFDFLHILVALVLLVCSFGLLVCLWDIGTVHFDLHEGVQILNSHGMALEIDSIPSWRLIIGLLLIVMASGLILCIPFAVVYLTRHHRSRWTHWAIQNPIVKIEKSIVSQNESCADNAGNRELQESLQIVTTLDC